MAKTEITDPKSTFRKKARRTLFRDGRAFWCEECGVAPKELPPDFPVEVDLLERIELAPHEKWTASRLEANHISKDISDNSPANLEWLCPSCHNLKDKQTKGEQEETSPLFVGFPTIPELIETND